MDERNYNNIGFSTESDDFVEEDEEIIELIDAITADEDELEEADVDLTDMLLTTEQEELEDVIESDFAIDVAIAMEEFTDEELLAFYERLDHEHVAQVLEQMDEDMQQRFVDLLDYEAILGIFKYMSNDDIADIIGEMPVNRRKTILRRLKSSNPGHKKYFFTYRILLTIPSILDYDNK